MTTSNYDVIRAYARTAMELSHEAVTSCEILESYGRLCWHAETLVSERPHLKEVVEAILGEAGSILIEAARERGYEAKIAGTANPYSEAVDILTEDPRIQRINPLCRWIARPGKTGDEIPEEA